MRSAVSASSRSLATDTSTMPANLPANRDIWLRSQLAPCALIGTETADTRPGRSSPITVRTKVAILAGYETHGTESSRMTGRANTSAEPPDFPRDQRVLGRESFRRLSARRRAAERGVGNSLLVDAAIASAVHGLVSSWFARNRRRATSRWCAITSPSETASTQTVT